MLSCTESLSNAIICGIEDFDTPISNARHLSECHGERYSLTSLSPHLLCFKLLFL